MYAKVAEFSTRQQDLARWAKLLSHPARIAILEYLAGKNTCISGDISAELPLSRTTVSQHLQELKQLDLIKGEIDGVRVCYCINWKVYRKMQKQYLQFFQQLDQAEQKAACC